MTETELMGKYRVKHAHIDKHTDTDINSETDGQTHTHTLRFSVHTHGTKK